MASKKCPVVNRTAQEVVEKISLDVINKNLTSSLMYGEKLNTLIDMLNDIKQKYSDIAVTEIEIDNDHYFNEGGGVYVEFFITFTRMENDKELKDRIELEEKAVEKWHKNRELNKIKMQQKIASLEEKKKNLINRIQDETAQIENEIRALENKIK